jgi:hypothetical protein
LQGIWKEPVVVKFDVLLGTWSLTLREEHRLRVFENRVLRRIFGPERDEVNQHLIQEEIKRRLNSGNACYHSVQTLLSSRLLFKKLKN